MRRAARSRSTFPPADDPARQHACTLEARPPRPRPLRHLVKPGLEELRTRGVLDRRAMGRRARPQECLLFDAASAPRAQDGAEGPRRPRGMRRAGNSSGEFTSALLVISVTCVGRETEKLVEACTAELEPWGSRSLCVS